MLTNQTAPEDSEFVESLEAFEIEPGKFDHRSHIRMAYTYLREYDVETTCRRIRRVLCSFLSHNGIEPALKYHETMTQAWTLVVCHLMAGMPDTNSAAEFMDANPGILDTGLMLTHYSKDVLFSDAARNSFVEPDLAPIPRCDVATPPPSASHQ